MVIVFMADLTLAVVFKLSAWCLGKTWDGIGYLVSRSNKTKDDDDDDDDEFVVISREDYRALRRKRDNVKTIEPTTPTPPNTSVAHPGGSSESLSK
jgi:hypothetical protein